MVERFGYSLDIGKSLEHEQDDSSTNKDISSESQDNSKSPDSSSQPQDSSQDESSNVEVKEEDVDSGEGLSEPIVDDSDEEITGEMLSANRMKKDILEQIKEDVEDPSYAETNNRASDELDDLEDDKDVFNPTSEDAYSSEGSVELEQGGMQAEAREEFEEPMPETPEEEPAYEAEKPLTAEEEDVKDMVDKSFTENNHIDEIIEEDRQQTRSLWKWGAGIALLLILLIVVVKMGFIGPIDNTPSSAVPSVDDLINLDSENMDEGLVTDLIPAVQKDTVKEAVPVAVEDSELGSKEIIKKDSITIITDVKEKDPEQLLSILKEGLE